MVAQLEPELRFASAKAALTRWSWAFLLHHTRACAHARWTLRVRTHTLATSWASVTSAWNTDRRDSESKFFMQVRFYLIIISGQF